MELIKNSYKKLISYGLIVAGIIIFILIMVVRPSRTVLEEIDNHTQKSELINVDFPFIQHVKIPEGKLSFLEIRFGDDSINQYQYVITATYESEILFEHTYVDEVSNIIRVPIVDPPVELVPDKNIEISIDCQGDCSDVKFKLHNSEEELEILYGIYKRDLGLLWYGLFPIVLGLTLLPLTKEKK